jgi:hypothetical protein
VEAALLQPVAQDESNVIKVCFDNKSHGSWQAARDAFNQLKNKNGGKSVWSKLTLVPNDKDDDESPFKLRCFNCGNVCQLGNPSGTRSTAARDRQTAYRAKSGKISGSFSSSCGVDSLDAPNKDANTIANYLNDSGCSKAIVHQHQQEIYGAKQAIAVSVPTRFRTNQVVMKKASSAPKQPQVGSVRPKMGETGWQAKNVGELFSSCTFWANPSRATVFLQPFHDYIHQMEADRPALGRVYKGLFWLNRHVRSSLQNWEAADPELADSYEIALRTWERRLEKQHSSAVLPLLQSAHVAAYMLDPLYADAVREKEVNVPKVQARHEDMARKLIPRAGGAVASGQFAELVPGGYSVSMRPRGLHLRGASWRRTACHRWQQAAARAGDYSR